MAVHNIKNTIFQQGTTETVQSTGTSAQSTVLSTTFGTNADSAVVVQLVADGTLFFLVGTNPTATTSSGGGTRLPDGAGMNIVVPAGSKIATISASGTTNLNITHLL